MAHNSTTRFSNRVDNYVKYRPGYPSEIVDFLQEHYAIHPGTVITDIGSGTGISTELFLKRGYTVIGIEPNDAMRQKSVELLGHYPAFRVSGGTAEHTQLDDKSVDMILAGQAFHWFNNEDTKKEFYRILKPGGLTVLMWNERLATSDFEKEYDQLITQHSTDYARIDHRNTGMEEVSAFFAPLSCELHTFRHYQEFDFAGLKGRLLSSSYIPLAGEKGYDELMTALEALFQKYQQNNLIRIVYDTNVYVSRYPA